VKDTGEDGFAGIAPVAQFQTSGDRRNLTCLSLVELLAVAPSG